MVTKYPKFGDGYKAEAVKPYRESNQTIAEPRRPAVREQRQRQREIQLQGRRQHPPALLPRPGLVNDLLHQLTRKRLRQHPNRDPVLQPALLVTRLLYCSGPAAILHRCNSKLRVLRYTSGRYRDHLFAEGTIPSVGNTGICYDNAAAESLNATIKKELIYQCVARRGRSQDLRVRLHRAILQSRPETTSARQ